MANYYNELDPKMAAWLRALIAEGLVPPGEVDERSITDVRASDLRGFSQCHFFAGIGGWSLALKLSGWPADRPVWTGSCPCQPFSCAGKGKGEEDHRHVWPEFGRLIRECRPECVFGEQVASAAGRIWLAGIQVDLEEMGFALGAADLCSAGVGAPNIRQRLYWVADSASQRLERSQPQQKRNHEQPFTSNCGRLAHSNGGQSSDGGIQRSGRRLQQSQNEATGGMGDTELPRPQGRDSRELPECAGEQIVGTGGSLGFWSRFLWNPCSDGRQRRIPVEPAFFPLVAGLPGRVVMLKGFGNAINPQVAREFIKAYMSLGERTK